MAVIKILLTAVTFYILNSTQHYWYFYISWFINWVVIVSIAWWLSRLITRDFLCKWVIPRIDPTGKAVLITGCGSGFGYMTAIKLNEMGFTVFAGFRDSNGMGAKQLLTYATSYPNRIVNLQMDVTNQDEVSAAYEKVKNMLDDGSAGATELFAVINNAGVAVSAPVEWAKENSIDPYDLNINVNTLGPIRVTRKFLPLIRRSKGRIINVSSLAARLNLFGLSAYSVSKAAMSKFTEALQEELSIFGVKAIDINPSFYKTAMVDTQRNIQEVKSRFEESSDDVKKAYDRELETVLKRILSIASDPMLLSEHPEHVVDAIVDGTTSAEPDAVYRIVPPILRVFNWIIIDFLPWDFLIYTRRLMDKLGRYNRVNVDEYLHLT